MLLLEGCWVKTSASYQASTKKEARTREYKKTELCRKKSLSLDLPSVFYWNVSANHSRAGIFPVTQTFPIHEFLSLHIRSIISLPPFLPRLSCYHTTGSGCRHLQSPPWTGCTIFLQRHQEYRDPGEFLCSSCPKQPATINVGNVRSCKMICCNFTFPQIQFL